MALTQLPISQSSSFTEFVTCQWLSDLKIHRLKDRGSHGLYDCGGDSLVPRPTLFFTLQFALTIVHGSGSAVKNGEGLGAFKTVTLFFPPPRSSLSPSPPYSKQDEGRAVPWRSSNLILTYTGEDGVQYELFNSWQFMYPLIDVVSHGVT